MKIIADIARSINNLIISNYKFSTIKKFIDYVKNKGTKAPLLLNNNKYKADNIKNIPTNFYLINFY